MTDEINVDLTQTQTRPPQPTGKARKLLQRKEGDDYVLQIDNTSLETFNTCPRSAFYRLIMGRVPHSAPALIYGSAIHEGLEYYYKNIYPGTPYDITDTELTDILVAALNAFGDSVQAFPMNEWRTPDRCCDTLTRYFNHYNMESFKLLDNGVERAFSLPLGIIEYGQPVPSMCVDTDDDEAHSVNVDRIHIYWTGKIDLALQFEGANWIMDHKTTSMMGPTFWKQFEISNQMLGYVWAAQQMFDCKFSGLIVNAIAGRKMTKSGTPTAFERERIFYRQDQVREWEENTMHLCTDFVNHMIEGYFPMKTAWCVGKYGTCKYHDVCTLEEDSRHSLLYSDQYTDNTWSPLNK